MLKISYIIDKTILHCPVLIQKFTTEDKIYLGYNSGFLDPCFPDLKVSHLWGIYRLYCILEAKQGYCNYIYVNVVLLDIIFVIQVYQFL